MADWLAVPLLCHEGGKSPKRVGLAHPLYRAIRVFTRPGRQPAADLDPERAGVGEALL